MTVYLLYNNHLETSHFVSGILNRMDSQWLKIFHSHYSHVIIRRHKSPASWLLKPLVQAQIKGNTKAPCHWPLWGESTGDRWISPAKGQWCGKCSHLNVFVTPRLGVLTWQYGNGATIMTRNQSGLAQRRHFTECCLKFFYNSEGDM